MEALVYFLEETLHFSEPNHLKCNKTLYDLPITNPTDSIPLLLIVTDPLMYCTFRGSSSCDHWVEAGGAVDQL